METESVSQWTMSVMGMMTALITQMKNHVQVVIDIYF